jgi:hypothetical protein
VNSGRLVTPLADAVVTQLARLTGRRADVLRDDLIGLVLEQSPEAQVTPADLTLIGQVQQGLDTSQTDERAPTIAEAQACLTMLSARGNPPFVIPDLVVNVRHLTEEELCVWHTLLGLYESIPSGWALVGGQMVHVHCWQRGVEPPRVTTDADLIVDLRADRQSLTRISDYLARFGYEEVGRSPANIGHRCIRDRAVIDLLIPEGLSERAAQATTVTGARTVQVPGGTQALDRAQVVAVELDDRRGYVIRPSLLGALVGKAAALEIPVDPGRERHVSDFATLTSLIDDPIGMRVLVKPKDKMRVARMIAKADSERSMWQGAAARGTVVAAFDSD